MPHLIKSANHHLLHTVPHSTFQAHNINTRRHLLNVQGKYLTRADSVCLAAQHGATVGSDELYAHGSFYRFAEADVQKIIGRVRLHLHGQRVGVRFVCADETGLNDDAACRRLVAGMVAVGIRYTGLGVVVEHIQYIYFIYIPRAFCQRILVEVGAEMEPDRNFLAEVIFMGVG